MPNFTILLRGDSPKPFEGTVQAASLEAAMDLAERMGHAVDRDATLKLASQDADHPGRSAAIVATLLALAGWMQLEIGLAAIVCAVIAVERSRNRRGIPALIFAFLATIAGMVIAYMAATDRRH
jgi:hypothetical protein